MGKPGKSPPGMVGDVWVERGVEEGGGTEFCAGWVVVDALAGCCGGGMNWLVRLEAVLLAGRDAGGGGGGGCGCERTPSGRGDVGSELTSGAILCASLPMFPHYPPAVSHRL